MYFYMYAECVRHVCARLRLRDVCRASAVCRAWRAALYDDADAAVNAFWWQRVQQRVPPGDCIRTIELYVAELPPERRHAVVDEMAAARHADAQTLRIGVAARVMYRQFYVARAHVRALLDTLSPRRGADRFTLKGDVATVRAMELLCAEHERRGGMLALAGMFQSALLARGRDEAMSVYDWRRLAHWLLEHDPYFEYL